MEQKKIIINYTEYSSSEDLGREDKLLYDSAVKAAEDAYAPYSGFCVGAALKLDNGEVVCANNQENAAYPSGLCAERVALFYAHSRYPEAAVVALAVVGVVNGRVSDAPAYPCGACRQVLAESQKRGRNSIRIINIGAKKIEIVENTDSLLPFVFDNIPE
jgi:cytidine deaminase